MSDDDLPPGRTARVLERWRPLLALVLAIPLAVLSVRSSLYWSDRPFPGFFVMTNRLVSTVGLPDWTGRQAGLPNLARVVAVDGTPATTAAQVYAAAERQPIGQTIRYDVRLGERQSSFDVATMRFGARDWWLTFGLFLMNGLLVIAAGIVVALLQPRTYEASGFLAFSTLSGFMMLSAPLLYAPNLQWLTPLHMVAQAFWGAGFLHLGLVFPTVRPLVARRPAWLLAPYLFSAVLAAWCWRGFLGDPPELLPTWIAYVYTALSMLGLAGLLLLAYRENATLLARPRLRMLLPAFVMSCSVAFFAFLENAFVGRFPINLAVLLPVFFYLAVAYAIVRHDLFDIDRLIRQAAVYATLTLAITGTYALALVVLGWLPALRVTPASPVFNIAFVVLVATLFEPVRRRVQRLLDHMFFRARVDYRRTVKEVSGALTTLLDLDEILARVASTVAEGFTPASLQLVLWLPHGTQRRELGAGGLRERPAVPTDALRAELVRSRTGWRVPPPELTPDALIVARAEAGQLGAALVVPLASQDRVIGAFALGPKRSGLPYTTADCELLETLAAQSAIAIQNALLFGEVSELNRELEAKVEHRTAELQMSNEELRRAYRNLQDTQAQLLQSEKLASLGQLVAGFAHEINTPVTAVVGNVKPLGSELARLRDRAALHGDATLDAIANRLRTIFEVMARGAERTAGIVQDLRVFSRVDETKPLPMDLHEGLEVSLRLLQPRWADRITIHRDYGELPPVEAAAGQINQVLMNLLANACDAIGERGSIWLRTRCDGALATVEVRDDGAGIPPEIQARIFDPFFTTKPVGKGTGLGLAISASIVRDHGGTLAVESVPGQGATFRVELPVRAVRVAAAS